MTTCLNCAHQDQKGFVFCPKCGTRAPERADPGDSLLGRTLNGKYRIVAEIGAGAMGTVYLGEHLGLKKKVALKVLHPNMQITDEGLQRFQREGIAAGKFTHPNAIQIFDFDRGEGQTVYLAMEYVEGSNLKVFLRRKGRLAPPIALRLIRQLVSVLAEAHRSGIVHRDLKPDNIMVATGTRGELRIKVLDFGLSKLVDRSLDAALQTEAGRIMGTPLYMSPEQCAGEEADERSDIYAAGLILFEILAGIRPFNEESTTELLITRATREAPSLLGEHPDLEIPEELDRVIVRALERRREDRFQNAEEMLQALDAVPIGGASAASTTSATRSQLVVEDRTARSSQPGDDRPRARPRRLSLLVAGIVGAAVIGVWALTLRGPADTGSAPARVSQIPAAERDQVQSRYVSLLEAARSALRAGESADAAIDQAMGLACRDAEAFVVRAAIYRWKDDEDPALADLREASRLDPSYLEPVLALGWAHFEGDRLDEAHETFAEAEEIAPDDGEVVAGLGAVAHRRGEPEARELLERAVERTPDSTAAALYLGRLRLDAGELEAAVDALVSAKRNDPRSWRAYAWLSEVYLLQERFDLAESQLREALDRNPAVVGLRIDLAALLLDRGRNADALVFLEESLRAHSDSGRLHIVFGLALRAEGRLDEAIGALERGVRLEPRDVDARSLLGVLLHRADRLEDAVVQYEAALELDGELLVPSLNLGLALFALERYEDAVERFERVLTLDPGNAAAHFHLGLLHMDYVGGAAKAVEHFQRYRELGGDDARVDAWLRAL